MRIFLTGFMGAGKTSVGRLLADRLSLPFIDLDEVIEARAGMLVREIFQQGGEGEFRRFEREVLKEACEGPESVVATGGGTVTFEANRDLIRRTGISVWLNPPFASILGRIGATGKEDRPLFRTDTQAWELYRARLEAYRRCDLEVQVAAEEDVEQIVGRILFLLRRQRCGT